MLFVTACALVLAVYVWAGGMAALGIAFFLLTAFAHLFATWLGNQLRDESEHNKKALVDAVPTHEPSVQSSVEHPRTAGYLSHRTWLGWQIVAGTVLGGLLGAGGGVALMQWVPGPALSWVAWTYGLVAFSVLGGLAGFAITALVTTLWRAWREATYGSTLAAATRGTEFNGESITKV